MPNLRVPALLSMVWQVVATGCAGEPAVLVQPSDWALVAPADDPWPGAAGRPPCEERAVHAEEGTIELDTGACGWITVGAPSRAPWRRGDRVQVLVIHSALVADAPAVATLALRLDGEDVWSTTLDVPAAAGFLEVDVPAPAAGRAGAPMYLHVDNHGANSYRFGALRAAPPP